MHTNPPANRRLLHTRTVTCQGYIRDDGLWDIEARMTDIKSFAISNPDRGGLIPAGEPLHDMVLGLTIDRNMRVIHVDARIDLAPFRPCATIARSFSQLKGMSLTPGFLREVKETFGGTKGCTHLVELLPVLATTAYQTLWQAESGYDADDPAVQTFLIDSCHALAGNGEVVQRYFSDQNELASQGR